MKTFHDDEAKIKIAKFIAKELIAESEKRDIFVNLGIGIPTIVAEYLHGSRVFIHSENGMLGVGPFANEHQADPRIISAGRAKVKETLGCYYMDSADSFGMIRGGHLDATVIGAFEVDQHGNVANWIIPNGTMLGVGGAMDLVSGAKRVFVALRHLTRDGKSKFKEMCMLPVTGFGVVDTVISEYAVFRYVNEQMVLTHIDADTTQSELRNITSMEYIVSDALKTM